MSQSLLIAVRFHDGRYHGQADGFGDKDGWPPSPGRLFQALVAGAARGADLRSVDRRALEWLERLDPPRIAAPAVRRGRAVRRFVPNNDLDSVGADPARIGEIRVGKQWRPCFFDPEIPILFAWRFESGTEEAAHICSIAMRLCQLGRGIDMAWASGQILDEAEAEAALVSHPGVLRTPTGAGMTATPHSGTLASLSQRFQSKRQRLTTVGEGRKSRQLFTQPPKASFARAGYDLSTRRLHFELRRSGLRKPEHGFAPQALTSVAPLLTGLRDAAARRLQDAVPEQATLFERLIVGRGAKPQDLAQRIRLVAVPSIGTQHTDLSIRRLMVEVPPECPIRPDDLAWAFAGLPACDPHTGEFWRGHLVSTEDARMAQRFASPAREFRSITPLVLSGTPRRRKAAHDKPASERSREESIAAGSVVQALRHAGIRIKPTNIRVQREPFHRRGVRAERFATGSRFSKGALWHVRIEFCGMVTGPLVLGNGRFCGLGLMEPVPSATGGSGVFVFRLDGRPPIAAEHRPALVRSLRRALMSLARDDTGGVDRLFSGHERDGPSDRAGHHAHVFLAADGDEADDRSITRLIVAAPWAVDRRAGGQTYDRQRRFFDDVVRRLTELRAGPSGRFAGLAAEPVNDDDPLLGPATLWLGRTSYIATRNLKKRDDPASLVRTDVLKECRRRGLPSPAEVEVLDVTSGPRGGQPAATLRLRFATAVRGPILLGRDSHAGGGLFRAMS